mmetsp:Transcript_25978/g.71550  ORF Transcript_25978/g.71550 Transcript_25978/m.71550 type:complete len:262 (-) Transcript_25978:540-1325(-)
MHQGKRHHFVVILIITPSRRHRCGGDTSCHSLRGNDGAQRHVTTGQGFANAQNIRRHTRRQGRKWRITTRPSKSRGNFVANQQDIVFRTQFAGPLEVAWVIKAHASRSLYNGFQNQGRKVVMLRGNCLLQIPHCRRESRIFTITTRTTGTSGKVSIESPRIVAGRSLTKHLLGQDLLECRMHARHGIAHAHGAQGISVVSGSDAGNFEFIHGRRGSSMVLPRHFQGHFDGHATRIGVKDFGKVLRSIIIVVSRSLVVNHGQ